MHTATAVLLNANLKLGQYHFIIKVVEWFQIGLLQFSGVRGVLRDGRHDGRDLLHDDHDR